MGTSLDACGDRLCRAGPYQQVGDRLALRTGAKESHGVGVEEESLAAMGGPGRFGGAVVTSRLPSMDAHSMPGTVLSALETSSHLVSMTIWGLLPICCSSTWSGTGHRHPLSAGLVTKPPEKQRGRTHGRKVIMNQFDVKI